MSVNKNPKVSIIILNYNGMPFVDKCFHSIREQTYKNIETIFFDNDSPDESVEYTRKNWPGIQVTHSKINHFFAKGNNEAAKLATGDYFFFLNNDTYLHPQCIEKLVEAIEEGVGTYAPKMMDYEGKQMIELGMGVDKYAFPWQKISEKIFYVEGSGLFIQKELWQKLGGFDEAMVNVVEDLDLCWRLQLLGYRIKKVPEAIFYHYGGATLGGTNTVTDKKKNNYTTNLNKRYHGERNQLRTLLKNYSMGTLLIILIQYYFWKVLEVGFLLLKGRFRFVWRGYIQAHWWNITQLPDTLRKRRKIQKMRTVSDQAIEQNMTPGNAKLHMFRLIGTPKIK